MAKPSILFINRVYPPERGATGTMLRSLAHGLAQNGRNVTVLTTGPKTLWERDGTIPVRRIKASQNPGTRWGYGIIWLRLLLAALRMQSHFGRFDYVVTLTDPPMLAAAGNMIRRFKKAEHIHWCQDTYPDLLPALGIQGTNVIQNRLHNLSRQAMNKCRHVVAIGHCMASHLAQTGVEASRLTIIPNWPDPEIFENETAPEDIPQWDAGLPLLRDNSPRFRILYAGTLGKAHPVRPLIEAIEILAPHKDIEFVFVGNGPGHRRLAHERDKKGLQNIQFLPWQPPHSLHAILHSADIHLISQKSATAGLLVPSKIYAALASGRPCIYIGPRDTEICSLLEDFQAGCTVPPGNGRALAAAIAYYRDNAQDWFAARDGAKRASMHYTFDRSLAAWLHITQKNRQ